MGMGVGVERLIVNGLKHIPRYIIIVLGFLEIDLAIRKSTGRAFLEIIPDAKRETIEARPGLLGERDLALLGIV